jgi:glycosyltransferase involved in cell wall biosynthesis
MKVLCVIPVFNEVLNIEKTLDSVRRNHYGVDKFLFINSGSNDGSEKILKNSEYEVLNIEKNKGIGLTLIEGLQYCVENDFDVLTVIHGGNKMDTKDFETILNPILIDGYDCTWGSRFIENSAYNMPEFRKITGRMLSKLVSTFYQTPVTDATNGFRAYKVDLILSVLPSYNRKWLYGYAFESFLFGKMLNAKNIQKKEVPVTIKYNPDKVNTKIKPILNYPAIFIPYFLAKYIK